MLDAAVDGAFKGLYVQGEDILQSDPDTNHVAAGLAAMECVVVQDLFLNETANYAHVFLPARPSSRRTAPSPTPSGASSCVRKVMAPKNGYGDWEITQLLANAMGFDWTYTHPSEIMDEIAAPDADLRRRLLRPARRARLDPVAVQRRRRREGTPVMHIDGFVRGKGKFVITEYVADRREAPGRASRCCSPPAASSASTMSARRPGAPTTSSGTTRTGWRSIRTTPSSAASRDGDWVQAAQPRRRDHACAR